MKERTLLIVSLAPVILSQIVVRGSLWAPLALSAVWAHCTRPASYVESRRQKAMWSFPWHFS